MKVILEIWFKLSLNILERWVISWIYCFCHIIWFGKKKQWLHKTEAEQSSKKENWVNRFFSFFLFFLSAFLFLFFLFFLFLLSVFHFPSSLPSLLFSSLIPFFPPPHSLSYIIWQTLISTNMNILHNIKENRLRSKCWDETIYRKKWARELSNSPRNLHNANKSNRKFRL